MCPSIPSRSVAARALEVGGATNAFGWFTADAVAGLDCLSVVGHEAGRCSVLLAPLDRVAEFSVQEIEDDAPIALLTDRNEAPCRCLQVDVRVAVEIGAQEPGAIVLGAMPALRYPVRVLPEERPVIAGPILRMTRAVRVVVPVRLERAVA